MQSSMQRCSAITYPWLSRSAQVATASGVGPLLPPASSIAWIAATPSIIRSHGSTHPHPPEAETGPGAARTWDPAGPVGAAEVAFPAGVVSPVDVPVEPVDDTGVVAAGGGHASAASRRRAATRWSGGR